MKKILERSVLAMLFMVACVCLTQMIATEHQLVRENRWRTSPCGYEFMVSVQVGKSYNPQERIFALGEEQDVGHFDWPAYKERGDKIYKYVGEKYFPNPNTWSKDWILVMERTPQACKAWIAKTGIDLWGEEKNE